MAEPRLAHDHARLAEPGACYDEAVHLVARSSAVRLRSALRDGGVTPATFGAALSEVPPREHDQWLDLLWDIDEIPLDDPDLGPGCVPYLPCAAASVLDAIDQANVTVDDIFVDVGAGQGRQPRGPGTVPLFPAQPDDARGRGYGTGRRRHHCG